MSEDMLAALSAALDARQRMALAAKHEGSGEWTRDTSLSFEVGRIEDTDGRIVTYDEGAPTEEQAIHIAANDPAAVLRRVAADRKLIALYEKARAECPADGRAYDWESDVGRARTAALEEAVRIIAEGYDCG